MASWPATLPDQPLQNGYKESPPNLVIRTEMDAGPAKTRRVMTSNVRPFSCYLILTSAQLETFDAFFIGDCASGATRFTWTHPRTAVSSEFKFVGQPAYEPLSGTDWGVTFELELMP